MYLPHRAVGVRAFRLGAFRTQQKSLLAEVEKLYHIWYSLVKCFFEVFYFFISFIILNYLIFFFFPCIYTKLCYNCYNPSQITNKESIMPNIHTYKQLCDALAAVGNGETITLNANTTYHAYESDCLRLYSYHASNTETREENPNGKRVTAIYLKDKENVTIDGKGATLILHGIITPFLFDSCRKIVVKDLTVDYARHTMNEYTVESSTSGESIVRIHKDCLYEVKDGKLFFIGEPDERGEPLWRTEAKGENMLSMYCDPKTEHVKFLGREKGDRFPSIPTAKICEDLGDGRVRMIWKDSSQSLPESCIIQTRDVRRTELGGLFQYCEDLRLENLTIRFMHGFGLLCQFCNNVTYTGLDCTPADRYTIACNADFFHFSGCGGHIQIENCKAAGGHDDFVNVHGTHLRIIERNDSEKSLLVRFENPSTWGLRAFKSDDTVDFIARKTLLPYATATVSRVEYLNDTDIRIYLSELPKHIDLGNDVIENATQTPSLTVKNNRFGPSMGRGVLCTTRKPIRIENNEFYKLGGSVLLVADDCNFWMESGYATDILFEGNDLYDCGYGVGKDPAPLICVKPEGIEPDSPPVHKELRIINNRVRGSQNSFKDNFYFSIERVIEKDNKFEDREAIQYEHE